MLQSAGLIIVDSIHDVIRIYAVGERYQDRPGDGLKSLKLTF
jgi:hypothetical protein